MTKVTCTVFAHHIFVAYEWHRQGVGCGRAWYEGSAGCRGRPVARISTHDDLSDNALLTDTPPTRFGDTMNAASRIESTCREGGGGHGNGSGGGQNMGAAGVGSTWGQQGWAYPGGGQYGGSMGGQYTGGGAAWVGSTQGGST